MHKSVIQLTVIVCTHNRREYISECLLSLSRQAVGFDNYQVLIIDNASKDNTYGFVKDFISQNNLPNFNIIQEPEVGLSNARNRGLAVTQTEYIAFIDDDARVPENWIETALQIISEYQPDIFGGPAYPIFPSGKPDWYKDEYGVRGDMGETGWLTKGFIIGTNIFFRRELLIEYGGFDPNLGMKGDTIAYHEETKLVFRAFEENKKVYYSRELAVKDLIPDYKRSLAFFIHTKYQAGRYGLDLWKPNFNDNELFALLELISNTMDEFDIALMKRDTEKYPYPENYIIENLKNNFLKIGLRVEYFLKKAESGNPFKLPSST